MNRDPIITADRRGRQRRRSGRHRQRLSAILDELLIYGRALSPTRRSPPSPTVSAQVLTVDQMIDKLGPA
jgi:hypothetical protein